jgi:hypothetical protein
MRKRYVYNHRLEVYWNPNEPQVLIRSQPPRSTSWQEYMIVPSETSLPDTWLDTAVLMYQKYVEAYAQQEYTSYIALGGRLQ